MTKYWVLWLLGSFLSFLGPELYWLAKGRTENTLSGVIWRAENLGPGNPFKWNFLHLLVVSQLIVWLVWLTGHFGWGLWK